MLLIHAEVTSMKDDWFQRLSSASPPQSIVEPEPRVLHPPNGQDIMPVHMEGLPQEAEHCLDLRTAGVCLLQPIVWVSWAVRGPAGKVPQVLRVLRSATQ